MSIKVHQQINLLSRLVVNVVSDVNEFAQRRARLVLGLVKASRFNSRCGENWSRQLTSHPGQLSLAIPVWVGGMSTNYRPSDDALRLGIKADMAWVWCQLKCSLRCQMRVISECANRLFNNKVMYKWTSYLLHSQCCFASSSPHLALSKSGGKGFEGTMPKKFGFETHQMLRIWWDLNSRKGAFRSGHQDLCLSVLLPFSVAIL